jgi:hypothetical protein
MIMRTSDEQEAYLAGTTGDVATLAYILGKIAAEFETDEQRAEYLLDSTWMEARLTDAKRRADWCSCGRPAVQILDGGEWGPTGYCGAAQPPLENCDCGKGAERHDHSVCHIYGAGMAAR